LVPGRQFFENTTGSEIEKKSRPVKNFMMMIREAEARA
jgi:hypothetical protein